MLRESAASSIGMAVPPFQSVVHASCEQLLVGRSQDPPTISAMNADATSGLLVHTVYVCFPSLGYVHDLKLVTCMSR